MSIAQRVMEQPGRYSIQQLQQAMQDGTLPAYVAVPLIQEKVQMQKQFQQQQALQQPPVRQMPPIAQQVMQEAQMAQAAPGVEGLPSNLPQEYAGGGIVAFADNEDQPVSLDMPGEDIGSGSYPTGMAAELGMAGFETPENLRKPRTPQEVAQVVQAYKDANIPLGRNDIQDIALGIKGLPPPSKMPAPAAAKPPAAPAAPAAKPPAASPGFAGFGGFGIPADLKPKSAVEEYRRQMYGTETEPGLLARSEARQRKLDEQVAAQQNKVTGQAYETLEKQLRKEEEERGTEKEQAKAMAIFKAGLAMMSGTSPRALENIGKGAMVGAEDWQKASAEIKKAEKEHRRMLAEIDQARRAEKIGDRDKMIARLDKANEHAQRMDEQGVRGFMTAFGMDEETAREVWKTKFSAAKSVEVAAMQQEGKIESAMLRGMLSGSGEKGAMTQKQRGDTLLALETSPNVMAYKKQLIDQLGTRAQDTQQFKNAVAEKVQQEYKRLYGDRGVPSGSTPSGFTPREIEIIKKEGLAKYFPGLQ